MSLTGRGRPWLGLMLAVPEEEKMMLMYLHRGSCLEGNDGRLIYNCKLLTVFLPKPHQINRKGDLLHC